MKKPIIVCIGTKNSFYDNISNVIGDKLKDEYIVLSNVYAFNMKEKLKELEEIKKKNEGREVLAIDLSMVNKEISRPFKLYNIGLIPGGGLNKKFAMLGDKSIHIFIEYFVGHVPFEDMLVILSKKEPMCEGKLNQFNNVVNDVVTYIKNNFKGE